MLSKPRNTSTGTTKLRHIARVACGAALIAAGALAAACADAPSAPARDVSAAAPSLAKGGNPHAVGRFGESDTLATPVVAQSLLRTTPLAAPVSATFEITRAGGHFELPGTGLSFQVPPGAVPDQPLTVTVTAPAGDVIAYEFGPHGSQFKKPLEMRQDLRGTNWQRKLSPTFQVGYFAATSDLDLRAKTAKVRESLPVGMSATGQFVEFDVVHFSGYMVAWGFR